ncbi:MAG: hypothetical protein ACPH5P_00345 [Akkermansiaceae bacterium]
MPTQIDFPASPTEGDTHTQNDVTWVYNGNAWVSAAAAFVADDTPYDATWDSNTNAPTKNAIYDKIETLGAGGGGGTQLADSVNASYTALIAADGHSYNSIDGNARGLNAVDLQIRRNAMTEVAGGSISTIVGGQSNEISNGGSGVNGQYATIVGGGFNDILLGQYSTILGGYSNKVNPDTGHANYSIACGAQAHAKHANAFVYNDSSAIAFASLLANTFNIHAANGLRLVTDGNQSAGQVLTCDADGHGTWQDAQTSQSVTGAANNTISFDAGVLVDYTFGATNTTLTLTASQPGDFVLKLAQDATGSRTVTWPANVKWPGGVAPTLTAAANAVDIIRFYYDGTDFFGTYQTNFS